MTYCDEPSLSGDEDDNGNYSSDDGNRQNTESH